ncbi:hypothetical protein [Streptomyces sp. NPDC002564]|uniref:hypothetical protein n=1 Tax=Streptomyces sp. NPDC002564 TaxID=3364649 RepID=UPI0036B95014
MTQQTEHAAAFEWLARAQAAPQQAHQEWAEAGFALLPLGSRFNCVLLPGRLVRAAAGTTDCEVVNAMLAELLDGPVIYSSAQHAYYALVEPVDRWEYRSIAAMLGDGAYLTVPAADMRGPIGLHWAVPPRQPGDLCEIEGVAALLEAAGTGQLR